MIYVCYGVTKSASTTLYFLTERLYAFCGRRQLWLGGSDLTRNFIRDVDRPLLEELEEKVGPDGLILLKTHGVLHPDLAERLADGRALASSSIRDPREIALAMIDHGVRAKTEGLEEFTECRAVNDCLPSIDNQLPRWKKWSSAAGVENFRFNDICFDLPATVERLARQARLDVEPDRFLRWLGKARYNFGSGVPLRYRDMAPDDQRVVLDRYADLYAAVEFDTPAALAARARYEHRRDHPGPLRRLARRAGLGSF